MYRCRTIGLWVLIFAFLSALAVNAQEKKCNLEVRVFESKDILSLIGVKVSVKNLNSNTILDSGEQFDKYIFANLPEGDYEISANKENYKQSVYKYKLICKNPSPEGFIVFGISLWQGDSNEKVVVEEKNDNTLRTVGITESKEERLRKFAKVNNILNYDAVSLGSAKYPPAARAVRAGGVVYVQVTVNEKGEVISTRAVSGHPLLRAEAVKAAKESKFKPTLISGQDIKVTGFIIYNFVP